MQYRKDTHQKTKLVLQLARSYMYVSLFTTIFAVSICKNRSKLELVLFDYKTTIICNKRCESYKQLMVLRCNQSCEYYNVYQS